MGGARFRNPPQTARWTLGMWWRRSLPRHIGLELLVYIVLYYSIQLVYRWSPGHRHLSPSPGHPFQDSTDRGAAVPVRRHCGLLQRAPHPAGPGPRLPTGVLCQGLVVLA